MGGSLGKGLYIERSVLSGNPPIGRWMTAIAIFVLVIVLITLAELSKKPVLQKQVPLHPSSLIIPTRSGEHNQEWMAGTRS